MPEKENKQAQNLQAIWSRLNPVQASLFENWFSDFFGPLKGHLQIQLQLSILFQNGVNGHIFELVYSLNEFIKWNLEQLATEKTGGGGIHPHLAWIGLSKSFMKFKLSEIFEF